ncbi:MAG: carboxymuconolactone decarboxylase family protein [Planctomycetota bacterium]|jgi:uncharacterized peroxidase-related enzyme
MARIEPVDLETADPKSRTQLEGIGRALGRVPNVLQTIGHSPAALGAYLGFGQALGGGSLTGAMREQIALTVAGVNGCDYCASAHTALGNGQGVDPSELERNVRGDSADERTAAALRFARQVVLTRGFVEDADLTAVREAGYTNGEIVEIVATIAINILTNYFSQVAQTEIDFPKVEVGEPVHG